MESISLVEIISPNFFAFRRPHEVIKVILFAGEEKFSPGWLRDPGAVVLVVPLVVLHKLPYYLWTICRTKFILHIGLWMKRKRPKIIYFYWRIFTGGRKGKQNFLLFKRYVDWRVIFFLISCHTTRLSLPRPLPRLSLSVSSVVPSVVGLCCCRYWQAKERERRLSRLGLGILQRDPRNRYTILNRKLSRPSPSKTNSSSSLGCVRIPLVFSVAKKTEMRLSMDLPAYTSTGPSSPLNTPRPGSESGSESPFFTDHDPLLTSPPPPPHYYPYSTTNSPSSRRIPRHSRTVMPSRRRFSTRTRIAVIVLATFLFIALFRRHLVALALILNCYITWPISPPPLLSVNVTSLPSPAPGVGSTQFIPRNLHHVLLGPMGVNPPEDWLAARNSCLTMHATWDNHYFWTDDNADGFFEENYPWFQDTWNSYPSIVQRADALRYFVLHKFGGVFLDMDLFCRNPLDPLMAHLEAITPKHQHKRPVPQGGMYILAEHGHPHILLAPKANPVGVSNGFIISSRGHPLLSQMITFLPRFNLNFILSYATVMFSTGCMFISAHMQLFTRRRWGKSTVLVLDGVENMLNGNVDTPLFRHLGTSSWHSSDAKFIRKIVGGVRRSGIGMGWVCVLLVVVVAGVYVYRRRGGRTVREGVRRILRTVSMDHHHHHHHHHPDEMEMK